jgi:hypothetical protein
MGVCGCVRRGGRGGDKRWREGLWHGQARSAAAQLLVGLRLPCTGTFALDGKARASAPHRSSVRLPPHPTHPHPHTQSKSLPATCPSPPYNTHAPNPLTPPPYPLASPPNPTHTRTQTWTATRLSSRTPPPTSCCRGGGAGGGRRPRSLTPALCAACRGAALWVQSRAAAAWELVRPPRICSLRCTQSAAPPPCPFPTHQPPPALLPSSFASAAAPPPPHTPTHTPLPTRPPPRVRTRLDEFSGDGLGQLLRAFGDMGYYDDELLEGVVGHVAAHPHKFSAENIADVVRGCRGGGSGGRLERCDVGGWGAWGERAARAAGTDRLGQGPPGGCMSAAASLQRPPHPPPPATPACPGDVRRWVGACRCSPLLDTAVKLH